MSLMLKDRPVVDRRKVAEACLDHHCNIHDKCGAWCLGGRLNDEQKKTVMYHLSITEHKALHDVLKVMIAPYIRLPAYPSG